MTDLVPVPQNRLQERLNHAPDRFEQLVEMTLASKSRSTQEMYRRTYAKWKRWCDDPMNLSAENLQGFLESSDTTKATRQREKAAMKQLLDILVIIFPDDRNLQIEYALFDRYRVRGVTGRGKEREPFALSTEQVQTVRDYWKGGDAYRLRNYAMIALMFASGLRAGEIVRLRWKDIDLKQGIVHVRHGKGDKERFATIFGNIAIDALSHLREAFPAHTWVFTPFAPYTHEPQGDSPITYRTLKQVIELTAAETDIAFTPHDARHTLLTELINVSNIVEAQAQAGHSSSSTTAHYGHASDAITRRNRTKISYG